MQRGMSGVRISHDDMKTVIVFSAQLLPVSETFILEQVRTLRDWRVVLLGRQLTLNGLTLDGFDVRFLHPPGHLHRWGFRFCQTRNLPYPPSLRRLRGIAASLVHVHFGTNAVDIWPLVRVLKLPMLITLHGYDINIHRGWWKAGYGGWHRRSYPDQLLRLAGEPNVHFLAVSESIRRRAIECGIPLNKITVHHIGVDTRTFKPESLPVAKRSKRVLFVGRLIEKKGLIYLLRAFVKVQQNVPNAELVIVGDGPLYRALKSTAADLYVRARFLGSLSHKEVRKQMGEARLLCLPSITASNGDAEGLPIVILEAQACGLPVVTSSNGGAKEGILDSETGYAVPEQDYDSLSQRLISILTDDEMASMMSHKAVMNATQRFSLTDCTARLQQVYDRVGR